MLGIGLGLGLEARVRVRFRLGSHLCCGAAAGPGGASPSSPGCPPSPAWSGSSSESPTIIGHIFNGRPIHG